jgi:hypothetical protein
MAVEVFSMPNIKLRRYKQPQLIHKKCGEEVEYESIGQGFSVTKEPGKSTEAKIYKNVSGYRCRNCGFVDESEVKRVTFTVEETTEDNPDELLLF